LGIATLPQGSTVPMSCRRYGLRKQGFRNPKRPVFDTRWLVHSIILVFRAVIHKLYRVIHS